MIYQYWPEGREENDRVADMICRKIWGDDTQRFIPGGQCLVFINEPGDFLAGFVYHNWEPESGVIEISAGGDGKKWMTRGSLYIVHWYPFEHLGCQMIVERTDPENRRVNRQLEAYGFRPHRIERLLGRNTDGIVWTLTREDWYANGYHPQHAAAQTGTDQLRTVTDGQEQQTTLSTQRPADSAGPDRD